MKKFVMSETAARKFAALCRGKYAAGVIPMPDKAVDVDEDPYLFRVKWSQSENADAGAWVVYIPDLSKAVFFGSSYVTLANTNLTAADYQPAGWYKVTSASSSSSAIWVNITAASGSTPASAYIDASNGGASVSLKIADISAPRSSPLSPAVVDQHIIGAITMGGSGGGGGGSGYTGSKSVVISVSYDTYTHQLTYNTATFTFADGLCTGIADDVNATTVFTAVEHIPHT